MKAHFEKAVELNPSDGMSHYCLGAWCFGLADLSWIMRNVAAAVFATPPSSTYEEALEHYLRAEKAEPGFWNKV